MGASLDSIPRLWTLLAACQRWGAIVLIDDADELLEARNKLDTKRNPMMAMVFQHLECFQGILFMASSPIRVSWTMHFA